ncbi:hypothetical protein [Aquitalea pelogenes]|uniref:hypothetical protein n=1 Tax=Aquitalea pelogenes TaxID=1293573 RepID=UPI0035AED731
MAPESHLWRLAKATTQQPVVIGQQSVFMHEHKQIRITHCVRCRLPADILLLLDGEVGIFYRNCPVQLAGILFLDFIPVRLPIYHIQLNTALLALCAHQFEQLGPIMKQAILKNRDFHAFLKSGYAA